MTTQIATTTLFALACAIYALLLTNGHLLRGDTALVSSTKGGLYLVFNSMAESLLHGRFDVDPKIIGTEGFLIDGRVIAYWGIPFAIIRLPLALFQGGLQLNVTGLSCLIAVSVAAGAKLVSLRLIFNKAQAATSGTFYWLLVLTVLFSGAQIEFLRMSVYQEVCLWAGALAALFVLRILMSLLNDNFSVTNLGGLAAIAGLALLSRVSTGIGLYTACTFLLSFLVVSRRLSARSTLAPLSILLILAGLAGFVNYERWGSPWVFADYHFYLANLENPERLERMSAFGPFNVARIPLSLLYYLCPIWVIRNGTGIPYLEALQNRMFDFAELPPSTFILTDAVLLGFALYTVRSMARRQHVFARKQMLAIAVAAGLCAPCVLMLTAISLSYRYRIEFYPLLELMAFTGAFLFLRNTRQNPEPAALPKYLIGGGVAISAVASICALLLYKLSALGPGSVHMHDGFWVYFTTRWHEQWSHLMHTWN